LIGQKYEHTTQIRRKNNLVVLASEIERVVAIESATLVSQNNIDKIIDKCYNWLIKTNTTNLKIVEGKHAQREDYYKYGQHKYGTFKYGQKRFNIATYDEPVNVGDKITAKTEYLGEMVGIAIKQTFSLNGNIIVKDTVMR
jgi:predicted metal-dependent hydrolase